MQQVGPSARKSTRWKLASRQLVRRVEGAAGYFVRQSGDKGVRCRSFEAVWSSRSQCIRPVLVFVHFTPDRRGLERLVIVVHVICCSRRRLRAAILAERERYLC